MMCHWYDNKMHGVAWAQVRSITFPVDRDVNLNCMDKFKFWTDFEKEIEFWKCSFKLLNAMLIKFMAVLSCNWSGLGVLTSSIRFCKQSMDAIVLLRLLCEWKSYGK